ncbi:unnamed protein product [Durusdinium trenchii]|uniref:WW domain-containing protein n=1 Tax=Durusdinium trenchii TaxID=1381693 RepID=A0ABP0JZ63_9DINO
MDPAEAAGLRQIWEVHPSPYGVPYYFNPKTKESRWSVPTGPLDLVVPPEEAKAEAKPKKVDLKPLDVECISSSCSSTSDSDEVQGTAAERAKQKVENFKTLLQEKGPGLDWAIPKSQRKKLFQSLVQSFGAGQRKLEAETRRQNREGFLQLLQHADFADLPVDSVQGALTKLEAHFGQDPRWSAVSAHERQRLVESRIAEKQMVQAGEEEKAWRAFRALLLETVFLQFPADNHVPSFEEVSQTSVASQPRWTALGEPKRREIYQALAQERAKRWARERRQETEEEDDLLEKRKRSRLVLAEEDFRSLLERKVKSPLEFSWKEVTMLLDGEKLPDLDEVDLETIFNQVRTEDLERRLAMFSSTLLRNEKVTMEMSMGEVIQTLEMQEHLRAVPENLLKKSWEDWRRFRLTEALEAFRSWLRESPELAETNRLDEDAVQELCTRLKPDIRFRRLDLFPSQRKRLIMDRLKEIAEEKLQLSRSDSDGG